MAFTDQKPRIATEKDCKARWACGANGKYFRCMLCGHKFQPGDIYRWVYCTDIGVTNIIVCKDCDGEDVKDRWKKTYVESKQKYWWIWRYAEK